MHSIHARFAALTALGAMTLLSACTAGATGTVTPGQIGASASPAASMSPGATSTAKPSATPTTGSTASPPAEPVSTGDEKEPNNDFTTAQALALDATFSGKAVASDDKGDYFKIVVPAGDSAGWLTVTATDSSDYAPKLTWHKGDKEWYAETSSKDDEANAVTSAVRAQPGNTYYMIVSPSANGDHDYKLKAEWKPVVDAHEPNDDFPVAKPYTLGQVLQVVTFWADDEDDDKDYFKFSAPAASGKLVIDIDNKTTSDDPGTYKVQVYDSAKKWIGEVSTPGEQANVNDHEIDIEAGGDFYLLVTGTNTEAISDVTVTAEAAEAE